MTYSNKKYTTVLGEVMTEEQLAECGCRYCEHRHAMCGCNSVWDEKCEYFTLGRCFECAHYNDGKLSPQCYGGSDYGGCMYFRRIDNNGT